MTPGKLKTKKVFLRGVAFFVATFFFFGLYISTVEAAVAYDALSESHTATTCSTSVASFTWNHIPAGTPKGAVVFVWTNANADYITSVTYGGTAMTQVGEAADTAGEPGRMTAFFLGASVPTGTQAIVVTRTNNATAMYAAAYTVTAATDTETNNVILSEGDAALAEVAVTDGSIGVNSVRFAGTHYGGNAIPGIGASSTGTTGTSMDCGTTTASAVRETTAGQGSRNVGFSATSEDRATVSLAIREIATTTSGTTGTQTANLSKNTTNNHIGGIFSFTSAYTPSVTQIKITEGGTIDAQNNLSNIKLRYEMDTSNPYTCDDVSYGGSETQYGSTTSFDGASGTATFTGSVAISSTSTMCVYPVMDVGSGATGGQTIEISIGSASDVTTSAGTVSGTPAISGTTTVNNHTTVGDGTDPSNDTKGPDDAVTTIDEFTVTTDNSTDSITALTVTLGVASSFNNLAKVEVTNTSNTDVCTDVDNPSSVTVTFTGCSITGTTTPTTYRVRITPKTHANMPAVPGETYGTTATVTAITGSNSSKTMSDTDSATITVDNLSPWSVLTSTVTAGDTITDLAWTNPSFSDFDTSGTVLVLRRTTSEVTDVPVEGATYSVGNTIGSSTVACVVSGSPPATSCQDTGLSNGTAYYYKVFTRDSRGNYSTSNFTPNGLTDSTRWLGVAVDSVDHDVYATAYNGDIYRQTSGVGSFSAIADTDRTWLDIDVDTGNDNVFAAVETGSNLYVRRGETGTWNAIGIGVSATWYGIAVNSSTHDVYISAQGGDIYKCTNATTPCDGTGTTPVFNVIADTDRAWRGLGIDSSTNNVYATVLGGDLYMQTNGTGSFTTINASEANRNWIDISPDQTTGNVYAMVIGSDVYKCTDTTTNCQGSDTATFSALSQTNAGWFGLSYDYGYGNLYGSTDSPAGDVHIYSTGIPTGSPATPVAAFTFSGTSSGLSDGTIVRAVINGSLNGQTTTVSSNAWSLNPSGSDPTNGQPVIIFATDGDGDIVDNLESTAASKYDGSGDMSGMRLYVGTVTLGSANSVSMSFDDLDTYTCTNDEDVMYAAATAGTFNTQGCSNSYTNGHTLSVLAANTLTVATNETVTTQKIENAGTITASGNAIFNLTGTSGTLFTNTGTFTEADSTVNVTPGYGATNPTILSAAETFYILKVTGANATIVNAGGNITTDNDAGNKLWIASGVFNQEGSTITPGTTGTLQVDSGAVYCLGGTTGSTSADCVSGTAQTTASTFPAFNTVTLDDASTVRYVASVAQTIETSDIDSNYGNLELKPKFGDSVGATYTFEGAATMDGDFIINPDESGSGTPVLTVNAAGNITVGSGKTTTVTKTNSATSVLDMRPASTTYNLSTGFLNVASGGTLDNTSVTTANTTLSGTGSTLFTLGGTFAAGSSTVTLTGGAATVNSGSPTFYNLTSSGTGTKTLGANINVDGNLTVSAGIFDPLNFLVTLSSGTLTYDNTTIRVGATTFVGNYSWSGSSVISSNSASIIEFNRSGDQTIPAQIHLPPDGTLATSGSGTKTLSSNIVLGTAVTIGSGTTLGLSSYTLTLSGTGASVLTGTGSLSGGTGTVKFTGNGSVTVPNYSYYSVELSPSISSSQTYTLDAATMTGSFNLVPAGSALLTVNMAANLAVTGTTTLQRTSTASVTLDTDTGTDRNLTTGYLSIQTGGTLDAGGSASDITLSGTTGTLFTLNSGTFTQGSSEVILSGNGDATINSGTPTFYDLTVSGTGTKTASSALTIGGALNISNASGTFNADGYDMTITGNVTNSGTFQSGAASGAVNGWSHYRPIVIDYTKVPNSTQTDFPVLVSGTYTYLKTIGNSGQVNHASGYDIAFYSDAGLTTMLKFEREKWVDSTGEFIAWVKVPTLSHTTNTTIYMAYGKSAISSDQSDGDNVWNSSFKGVWHLPNGTSLTMLDSTANNNDGSVLNEITATTGNANMDGGANFPGTDDIINVGTGTSLRNSVFTYSAWVKPSGTTYRTIIGGSKESGSTSSRNTPQLRINPTHNLELLKQDVVVIGTSTGTLTNGSWNHVAVTYNNSSGDYVFYINGSASGSGTSAQTFDFTSNAFWHGGRDDGSTSQLAPVEEMVGDLDEIKMSDSIRTGDWIATEYNSQNNPSTFYSVGADAVGNGSSNTIAVGGNWTNTGTVSAGASTIKLTSTSGTKVFAGGGVTYYNLWLAGAAGAVNYAINGSNTFNDIKDTGTVAHAIQFKTGDTQTLSSMTLTGAGSGQPITITSGDGSGNGVNTTHNLVHTGDSDVSVDYVVVEHSVASPYSKWLAGQNSTNNQFSLSTGSGWIFNTVKGSRGGGNGNSGGESSGGGTPVGGGTGQGGGGGGAGGEGQGGGSGQGGGTGQGGGGGDTGFILKRYNIASLEGRNFLASSWESDLVVFIKRLLHWF